MTRDELNALVTVLMCDDGPNRAPKQAHDVVVDLANAAAREHDFADWIDAYHQLPAITA